MTNPDFPQNREEMLLNAIAGSPYDVPAPAPQSRVEKWLAFLAENGIPGNVKIGEDVATVADLPTEGKVGDMHYVTAEELFYVWKLTDGVGAWIPVGADFDPSDFARADGNYPDMSVGYSDVAEYSAYAEQLDSNQKLTVSTPFVFRPSGGGADVEGYLGSKAEISAIYGKTLVWNQLCDGTLSAWNKLRVSVTTEDRVTNIAINSTGSFLKFVQFSMKPNHKYLISGKSLTEVEGFFMGVYDGIDATYEGSREWVTPGKEFSYIRSTTQANKNFRICSVTSQTTGIVFRIADLQFFDLTRMFGAGNEPASAADFRVLVPPANYAYDAGRLLHFAGTGIKTVGFNALAPDGTAKLLGGKAYEIVGTYTALSYSTGEEIVPVDGIFTPTADGILTVTGADAETCVHLVWSGYRNGESAQYRTETKALPISTYFPDGMRGIGTVRDELRADRAIKRCGERTYREGDESDPAVMTDRTNTVYALAEAVETSINPPLDLTFTSSDYGTELLLPENTSAPVTTLMYAAIDYVRNLRDKVQNAPDGTGIDGDYYVQIRGVMQTYKPLPTLPTGDGVYVLKCTVTSGTPTFAWVADAETQTEPPVE